MKKILLAATVCVAGLVAAPAGAMQKWDFAYSANVVGTQIVYDPNGQFCGSNPLGCQSFAPYRTTISGTTTIFSDTGAGSFEYGSFCANCFGYGGTITGGLVNGFPQFSGVNFSYVVGSSAVGSIYATAPSFYVRLLAIDDVAPLPEPATWGMLIVGFGAIGGAMRARRRARVTYA